jgi:hypothetical protein
MYGQLARVTSRERRRLPSGGAARLLAIPGVVRVGFGWKERSGVVLPELAHRVYVRAKHPVHEVRDSDRIPSRVDGIATDVLVADDRACAGGQTPTLTPGCQIQRHIPSNQLAPGTLGLLVVKNNKHYALTCNHVVKADTVVDADSLDVYSPLHTSCDCRDPVAAVQAVGGVNPDPALQYHAPLAIADKQFWVDVALVLVTAEEPNGTNQIVVPTTPATTIKFDQGLRDLSGLPATVAPNPDSPIQAPHRVLTTPVTVHKLGAATQHTKGVVVELSATQSLGPFGVLDSWEMRVTPAPGKPWTKDYEIAGNDPTVLDGIIAKFQGKPVTATKTGGMGLRLSGPVFAIFGDSGSPAWDDAGKLVGIVTGVGGVDAKVILDGEETTTTLPNGTALVQYAHAAFQALGLTAASILAPGTPLAAEPVAVPRTRSVVELRELSEARRVIEGTHDGRVLIELVDRHLEQITQLVHHRRHVKVVWHRNRGPAFSLALIEAMRDPERPLPQSVSGVRLQDALERFIEVLVAEGDTVLRRDLECHARWLVSLVSNSGSVSSLGRGLADPPTTAVSA